MDIVRVLSAADLEVRRKTLTLVMDLVSSRNIDEVRDTPLRQFTGFLIHVSGGREKFWEQYGQSYISKVCFLMGNTEDGGTRYNLKRRLEQVLGERKELSIWYNLMLKNSGLNPPL